MRWTGSVLIVASLIVASLVGPGALTAQASPPKNALESDPELPAIR
jgi:hypothetical protein